MGRIPGVADLGTFQVRGQPNVNLEVDRAAAGDSASMSAMSRTRSRMRSGAKQSVRFSSGEQRYDLTVRYQEPYRKTVEDISRIASSVPAANVSPWPVGARSSWKTALPTIYREGNSATSPSSKRPRRDLGRPSAIRLRTYTRKCSCPRATTSTGPGNTKASNAPIAALRLSCHHTAADVLHSLCCV